MKGVIVTADDFGAAIEINEAVEAAHRHGILTAASLMVTGAAARDAIARASRLPSLKVGLHVVLVEGRPALPPREIPGLVDAQGRFRSDMACLGTGIFLSPKLRRQLAAEITAQFEGFRASGLRLDHVNAHKHFHLHPTIAGQIIEIGCRYGMSAARVPTEPASVLRRIEPGGRSAWPLLLRPATALLHSRLTKAGLLVPRQVFGLAWSGAMSELRLAGILRHLPAGLSEIYLHPAVTNNFPGAAPGYRYAEELAALMAPSVLVALQEAGAMRGGFADFDVARRPG